MKDKDKPKDVKAAEPVPVEPRIGFAEYAGSANWSPSLLAGADYAIRNDGKPRKRTAAEWDEAVKAFASAPAH